MVSNKTLSTVGNVSITLNRTLLSKQVKEFIIDGIISGRFKSGEHIVENVIANELNVSQAPIREPIRELVMMGFLENEPYKGNFVRKFTHDELNEVYVVRAALESLAARQAAQWITDKDGETLHEIFDKMISSARANDLQEMVRLNNQFHETIIRISGNKLLLQLWKTLEFGQWTIFTTLHSHLELEFLAQRHKSLIETLLTRDPDAASEAMRHHIEDLGTFR